jgi:pimeloyl-ACP methyl ester carboxylesterase
MQIKEKYLELNGRKLWIRLVLMNPPDSDAAATLVFLHDALGSVAQWKDFPDRVAQATGFNVLTYDRFGHGLSDAEPRPPDQTFLDREALVVLPELLHLLKIYHPVLYGHSDGGTIALIYAAYIKTTALLLEAAHIMVEDITREGVLATSAQKEVLLPKLTKYHGDKAEDLFNYWSGIWSGDLMKDWNIQHILSRIDVPTLIFQGEQDNYGTSEQVNRIAQGISGPSKVFMLENCGHTPHKEYPDELVKQIVTFFNEKNLNI